MGWFSKILIFFASLGLLGLIAAFVIISYTLSYYGRDLPDYAALKDYEPPVITRIYAGDGRFMAEYAKEKRVFVPIEAMPDQAIQAFISAEDQNYFEHKGVDTLAIARAAVTNIKNAGSGRRLIGASTITQQVAKNFLLTNEVSYERKIKEAILALRMEKALSKERLLELYLNEIFLGQRAYGVAAASLIYFNKSLDELTLSEAAFLAALPKAPNNYHPVRRREAAIGRRNWVLSRMVEDGYITESQADLAKAMPLDIQERDDTSVVSAPYFAEEVRRTLENKYTADILYNGGLAVRTSIDPKLQNVATQVLREGLRAYDRRHGWRGPVATLDSMDDWSKKLADIKKPEGFLKDWQLAVVLDTSTANADIAFTDKSRATLKLKGVKWARKCLQDCYALGPEIAAVQDVVNVGDVIMVEQIEPEEENQVEYYVLRQIPKVQGAIIALDPHTGRVLAMQGGWKYGFSEFNRATQAWRQPGSAFKPFVYLPALDDGFTPATRVLDAPFVIEQAPGDYWRPTNYSNEFYGPTPIRVGIEKSRNLMTVRLADHIGMDQVVDYATRFGIADQMKPFLSYALGAGETTLLRLTAAYGMLVNGGKTVTPTFIDRIQDRYGKTIFAHDERPCANCGGLIRWDGQRTPDIPDTREQIADARTSYQIVSMLEGVVQRGTARRLADLGRPLAGKTGTTNESKDTWFIGFSPDLVVGVFVGFDDPKSLGKRETGSSVAAPIFKAFMKDALADTPPTPFRVPDGIRNVRVNASNGRAAMPGDANVIWEAFVTGTEPNADDYVLDTNVISGGGLSDPYGDDLYGYGQFGYGEGDDDFPSGSTYIDGTYRYNPETIGLPQGPAGAQINPSYPYDSSSDRTVQPVEQDDPAFSGTGGLY